VYRGGSAKPGARLEQGKGLEGENVRLSLGTSGGVKLPVSSRKSALTSSAGTWPLSGQKPRRERNEEGGRRNDELHYWLYEGGGYRLYSGRCLLKKRGGGENSGVQGTCLVKNMVLKRYKIGFLQGRKIDKISHSFRSGKVGTGPQSGKCRALLLWPETTSCRRRGGGGPARGRSFHKFTSRNQRLPPVSPRMT